MNSNYIRLKINISDLNPKKLKETKFWYLLNKNKLLTIEELERDLKNLLNEKFHKDYSDIKQLKLFIDEYLVPSWETSSILRDNDLIT